MMKTKLIAALIVGSFVLAGCGGGSGDSARDMEEETQLTVAEERIAELEEDQEAAAAQEEAAQEQAAKEQAEAAEASAGGERLQQEARADLQANEAGRPRNAPAGSRPAGRQEAMATL